MRGVKYDADNTRLQYALSGERYKLYTGDDVKTWQLFDLQNDPKEQNNLSSKYPSIVKKMKKELQNRKEDTEQDALN